MTPKERWVSGSPGYYQLARPKVAGFIRHYGVAEVDFYGRCRVFQLSPRGAQWTDLRSFADGENITVLSWKPMTEGQEILHRIYVVQTRHPVFSLFGNNCEHAARYIWTGERESRQVKGWGWAAAGLVLAILFGR